MKALSLSVIALLALSLAGLGAAIRRNALGSIRYERLHSANPASAASSSTAAG
jgi:hypothetical protein